MCFLFEERTSFPSKLKTDKSELSITSIVLLTELNVKLVIFGNVKIENINSRQWQTC